MAEIRTKRINKLVKKMLYTKSMFKKPSLDDGLRISVMSRHTLNDGKTLDQRITKDKYKLHLSQLAPPPKVVGAWYRKEISWQEFEQKYLEYIRTPKVIPFVNALSLIALENDVTILCAEEIPQYCHRRLLAEECKKYQSKLKIIHK